MAEGKEWNGRGRGKRDIQGERELRGKDCKYNRKLRVTG